MYDLVVIGGGPAALAAAFFAAGKRLNAVMVYEELGGKVGWLESLAGPRQDAPLPGNELAHLLTARTLAQPGRTIDDRVLGVQKAGGVFRLATERHGTLEARTVLVATGATPLPLRVPGADRFLEHGLGYSATTHAHLVAGQRVAVIGGGLRALSGAAEVAVTAAQVYVVAPSLRGGDRPMLRALAQRANVELLEGHEVRELRGAESLESLAVDGEQGPRELPVDRAFVALGVVPNSAVVADLVETDADGFILVNAFHETWTPGLYAAGDVSTIYSEQVITAIGDGARAAMSAYDYVLTDRLLGFTA